MWLAQAMEALGNQQNAKDSDIESPYLFFGARALQTPVVNETKRVFMSGLWHPYKPTVLLDSVKLCPLRSLPIATSLPELCCFVFPPPNERPAPPATL